MTAHDSATPPLQTRGSVSLEGPQQTVFDRFHDPEYGRVCVNAGAGTGKTMTMIRTVAQAVVAADAAGQDPFDQILLTTFSNDAAHELKTRLKAQLREHDAVAATPLSERVWRNIETNADIGTIDGFLRGLLDEIAVDIGVPASFDIRDSVTESDLIDDVFAAVRADCPSELTRVRNAFSPTDDRLPGYRELIMQIQQKCREYCWTPAKATQILHESLTEMHAGHDRPVDIADVQAILDELVPNPPVLADADDDVLSQLLVHVQETYDNTAAVIDAFGTVLESFERHYDRLTRETGALSHTDVTFLLVRELDGDEHDLKARLSPEIAERWRESLAARYQYVFVDEVQDTSYAQCRVLSPLIRNDSSPTQVLLIGDVKQSIYEWRSAEPEIFGDVIDAAQRADNLRDRDVEPVVVDDYFGIRGLTHVPLTLNFRSHPDIIAAANRLFTHVFSHPSLGGMGDIDIAYEPLDAFRDGDESDQAHVHAMDFSGQTRRDDWVRAETERIASIVATIVDPDGDPPVLLDPYTKSGASTPVPPDPGDVTLLFRSRTRMAEYAQALRERGLRAAVDASDDLFDTSEIKLIIDILEWFANPHSRPSLLRILRSPLVAVSDETLRTVPRFAGSVQALLDDWPPGLPGDDRARIAGLVALRDDLRWSREEAKSDLVHKILRHSGFEAVLLTNPEAIREYGNLWMLTELIDQWEDEELLAYRELVDRLTTLRDMTPRDQPDFTVAPIASEENDDAVVLTTVHASKGREFPVVFLVDLLNRLNFPRTQLNHLVCSRRDGLGIRPQPSDTPFPDGLDIDSPDDDGVWIGTDRSDGPIATATGPIWLSDERDSDGQFRYGNPLNRHLEREVAESWRNLYVAFTRAADHVFFGVCTNRIYNGEHTTWMAPLRDTMRPDTGFTPGTTTVTPTDEQLNDLAGRPGNAHSPFTLGIDDIPLDSHAQVSHDPDPLPDVDEFLTSTPSTDAIDAMPLRPQSLTATAVHDLLSCPRRYQYQHVQDVTPMSPPRDQDISPPADLAPAEWGTIVHDVLEAHVVAGRDLDTELATVQAQYGDEVVDELTHTVIPNFDATETGGRLQHDVADADVLAEETFDLTYKIGEMTVMIRGEIDLIYNYDGEWYIADYKTGGVRADTEYETARYTTQLQAYAWLLTELYDIDIVGAQLIYVHDGGTTCEVPVDPTAFEASLERIPDQLSLTRDNDGRIMLATDPAPDPEVHPNRAELNTTTRCGSCPFGASKGGPCRFG
ncbi:UvrD-helicase domain-containing protein [Halorubrum vacuolatum]|uniref:DNA 3'-5' helicase n=1 Tax=Halorubrum vacuolatum TaxID=63740 RepID=A0A238XDH0_HALVU|nr:UvrD-helicase domain-containing protein [Halorubrum vacuolatum]SNR57056.1 ATP-dependent helicase/nuclease subunit A [Halorubrum vacuolatum]